VNAWVVLRLCDARQALFASRQLLRNVHALGTLARIGGFGQAQQRLDFGLQRFLQLQRMRMGARAVAARIGLHLGPIEGHITELQQPVGPRDLQHLTTRLSI